MHAVTNGFFCRLQPDGMACKSGAMASVRAVSPTTAALFRTPCVVDCVPSPAEAGCVP